MILARWQATITDEAGNIVPGADIEVRSEIAGQPLVPVFADRDGTIPLGNPFPADGEGFAAFHAIGGAYQIRAFSGAFERIRRYVGIGLASETDGSAGGIFEGTEATVVARRGDLIPLQDMSDENDQKRSTAQEIAETARVVLELMPFGFSEDVATGDVAGDLFVNVPSMLNGHELTGVQANHGAAGTGTGTTTINIRKNEVDMLSTPLTIDPSETTSGTAATPAVINAAQDDVSTNNVIVLDVDAIPDGTAPQGLTVTMTFERPAS